MDASDLLRLRVGAEPSGRLDGIPLPDPREVDRICSDLKWPEAYCVRWITYAAGIPDHDPDGKPFEWTRRQVRGFLFMREMYELGRLTS